MNDRRKFLAGLGGVAGLILPSRALAFGRRRRTCAPPPCRRDTFNTKLCPQSCYAQVNMICYYRCFPCPNQSPVSDVAAICIDPNVLPVACNGPNDPLYCFTGSGGDGRPRWCRPVAGQSENGKVSPFDVWSKFGDGGIPMGAPDDGGVNEVDGKKQLDFSVEYSPVGGEPTQLRLFQFDHKNEGTSLFVGQEIDPRYRKARNQTAQQVDQLADYWHVVTVDGKENAVYHVLMIGPGPWL